MAGSDNRCNNRQRLQTETDGYHLFPGWHYDEQTQKHKRLFYFLQNKKGRLLPSFQQNTSQN